MLLPVSFVYVFKVPYIASRNVEILFRKTVLFSLHQNKRAFF